MLSLKRHMWGALALSVVLVPSGALAQTAATSGLLFPAVVRAQDDAPSAAPAGSSRRVFVEGSLLGSVDGVLRFEDDPHRSDDTSWTLAAGGSIGVFLTEAWTLRAELEVPRHAGSDIEAYGNTYYLSATAPGIEYRTATARRDITIVGLVGHQMRSSGRVRPSFRGTR